MLLQIKKRTYVALYTGLMITPSVTEIAYINDTTYFANLSWG